MSADLWWVRIDVAAWLKLTQTLTPTGHSAFTYLVLASWSERGDASVPACSLPNDDDRLMRMAQVTPAEWKKLGPDMRRIFAPLDGADDRLRSPLVWGWYQRDQAAHMAAVTNGAKGGNAPTKPGKRRGRPRKNSGANSEANSGANSGHISERNTYSELRGGFTPGASHLGGEYPPAADDAPLTPGGVASPSATANGNGHAPNGHASPSDVVDLPLLAPGESLRARAERDAAHVAPTLPPEPRNGRHPALDRVPTYEPITDPAPPAASGRPSEDAT